MTKKEIANRLRTAREMAGLSQGQAAKKLGLHRPTVSEIEAGRRNVRAEELGAFAKLYGVEIAWLSDGKLDESKLDREILAAARELSKMKEQDINKLISTIRLIKSSGRSDAKD